MVRERPDIAGAPSSRARASRGGCRHAARRRLAVPRRARAGPPRSPRESPRAQHRPARGPLRREGAVDAADARLAFHADMIAVATLSLAADAEVASRVADPAWLERRGGAARAALRGRPPRPPSRGGDRRRRASPGQRALRVAGQQPARGDRARDSRSGRRSQQRAARLLGGPRDALGAAHERRRDRRDRAARARGNGDRLRHRRAAAGRDRRVLGRPVGDPPDRRVRRRLHAGYRALRARAGCLHGHRRGPLQPARSCRLARRRDPDRGRSSRLRGQRGRRAAVLAARSRGGRRRRPRRRVPHRRLLPPPGRPVGRERAGGAAGRGAARFGGGGAPRRSPPRVPGRAGEQAPRAARSSGGWWEARCAYA